MYTNNKIEINKLFLYFTHINWMTVCFPLVRDSLCNECKRSIEKFELFTYSWLVQWQKNKNSRQKFYDFSLDDLLKSI